MKYFIVFTKTRNTWGGRVRYRHLIAAEDAEVARKMVEDRFGSKVKIHVTSLPVLKAAQIVMTQCTDFLST